MKQACQNIVKKPNIIRKLFGRVTRFPTNRGDEFLDMGYFVYVVKKKAC